MRTGPTMWDMVRFDGSDWQVVAADAGEVVLRSLVGARPRTVSVAALLRAVDYQCPAESPGVLLQLPKDLDVVPEPARRRALYLQRHVHELLTGLPPGSPPEARPKPEYDNDKTLAERVTAKRAELAAMGVGISQRTLWRYVVRYRAQGAAGLVDPRWFEARPVTGRVSPEVVEVVERVLSGQTKVSTGTRSRALAQVELEAANLGLSLPSRRTLYRLLARLDRQRHSFGNATTRRTQANRPNRAYGRQAPSRPGELVEIDSTPLDVFVIYPDGSSGRVDLTVAFDVATRTICAAILSPVAAKAVDAALLLARAMTPLPAQPGWADAVRFSLSLLPQGSLESPETLVAELRDRPIVPIESVTIDRGKVFVSTTFLTACERLQISVVKAAPRTPTDKPHVERLFGSINSLFTQYLAGYTGPNVVRRGADVAAEAVWPMAQVQDLLDQWIIQCWQQRPHPGLRLPAMPQQQLTPNEMFEALSSVAPAVPLVFDTDDYIALLPRAWRSVQRYGINFEGLTYDSPALDPFRGVRSGLRSEEARDKWEIRHDPYRMNRVYLRDHEAGSWIEAPWTLAGQTQAPFSIDVLRAARNAIARRREHPAPTATALLAEITRIQTTLHLAARAERSARRRAPATTPPQAQQDGVAPSQPPVGTVEEPLDGDGDLRRAESEDAVSPTRAKPRAKIGRVLYDDPSPDPPVRRRR